MDIPVNCSRAPASRCVFEARRLDLSQISASVMTPGSMTPPVGSPARQGCKEATWHESPHGPDAVDAGRPRSSKPLGAEWGRGPQVVQDSRENLCAGVSRRRSRRAGRLRRRCADPVSARAGLSVEAVPDRAVHPRPRATRPILRKRSSTGSSSGPALAEWHGDKIAVLSASRTELRAYNSPEVLKQVDEVVERFTNAVEDVLSVHVQFVAAVDTRWRYSVFNRLTFVGNGPQGQQIWTMRVDDAALVLSQMQVQQGFRKLADQRVEMINGQTLTIKTAEPRAFASGLQREGGREPDFKPRRTRSRKASS